MTGFIICTIVAIIMVYFYFNAMNITKRLETSPKVYATVVNCVKIDNDDIEAAYYHVTYEYCLNGTSQTYMENVERKKTIGKVYKKIVLTKKDGTDQLIDPSILKENKSSSPKLCFVVAAFFELIGIFLWFTEKNEELGFQIFGYVISILFITISGIVFRSAFKKKLRIKSNHVIIIPATVVGFRKRSRASSDNHSYTYFPIYEYTSNGEIFTFESNYSSSTKNLKKGEQASLYQDRETGEIFEPKSANDDLIIAIGFGVFGIVTLICLLLPYFTQQTSYSFTL